MEMAGRLSQFLRLAEHNSYLGRNVDLSVEVVTKVINARKQLLVLW